MVRLISINYITYTPKILFYLPTQHYILHLDKFLLVLSGSIPVTLCVPRPRYTYVRELIFFVFPGWEREVRLPAVPSCLHMLSICFICIYGLENKYTVWAACKQTRGQGNDHDPEKQLGLKSAEPSPMSLPNPGLFAIIYGPTSLRSWIVSNKDIDKYSILPDWKLQMVFITSLTGLGSLVQAWSVCDLTPMHCSPHQNGSDC